MRLKRFGAVAALVATGLAVGFVFGPSMVGASGQAPTATQVQIKDDTKSYLASVSSAHRLTVDTEADTTNLGAEFLNTYGLQYTLPNGQDVLASGGAGCSASSTHQVVLASININSPVGPASPTTVTVEENKTSPPIAYQTTIAAGEIASHDFSFDGGVYFLNGYKVVVSPSVGSLTCQVVGQDLGVAGHHPVLHAAAGK